MGQSRCTTRTRAPSGDLEFEPDVLEWLMATNGIIDLVDKRGTKNGDCGTALYPLMRALQNLCPDALFIHDYVDCLNKLAGLTHIAVFLQAVEEATPQEKAALKRVMAECVNSTDTDNTILFGSDGGLKENDSL